MLAVTSIDKNIITLLLIYLINFWNGAAVLKKKLIKNSLERATLFLFRKEQARSSLGITALFSS